MASSVWRPDPPRRRLPKMSVSGGRRAGLMLSSSVDGGSAQRNGPCDTGLHVRRRDIPAIAVDLAPRRQEDLAGPGTTGEQQQFQRPCRGLRALPQLGIEAGQIPPRHRRPRPDDTATRGRTRKMLSHGLGPPNRPGSTAIACSMVCSIRPRTRRAVSLVVSQTGSITASTSACVSSAWPCPSADLQSAPSIAATP